MFGKRKEQQETLQHKMLRYVVFQCYYVLDIEIGIPQGSNLYSFQLWIAPGVIGENGLHALTSVVLAKRCEAEKRMSMNVVASHVKEILLHTRAVIDLLS